MSKYSEHDDSRTKAVHIPNPQHHRPSVRSRHCRCNFGRVEVADALQPPDQLEIVVSRFRLHPLLGQVGLFVGCFAVFYSTIVIRGEVTMTTSSHCPAMMETSRRRVTPPTNDFAQMAGHIGPPVGRSSFHTPSVHFSGPPPYG